jgi:hypothetical protein
VADISHFSLQHYSARTSRLEAANEVQIVEYIIGYLSDARWLLMRDSTVRNPIAGYAVRRRIAGSRNAVLSFQYTPQSDARGVDQVRFDKITFHDSLRSPREKLQFTPRIHDRYRLITIHTPHPDSTVCR